MSEKGNKFDKAGKGAGGRGGKGAGKKGEVKQENKKASEIPAKKSWWRRGKGGQDVLPTAVDAEKDALKNTDKESEKEKEKPFELNNLNFVVPKGAFIGIVGRVGSGKVSQLLFLIRRDLTTIFRVLCFKLWSGRCVEQEVRSYSEARFPMHLRYPGSGMRHSERISSSDSLKMRRSMYIVTIHGILFTEHLDLIGYAKLLVPAVLSATLRFFPMVKTRRSERRVSTSVVSRYFFR